MEPGPWALARRIGLRNIAYLLFMIALAALAVTRHAPVAFIGGLISILFLVANLATLARAMGQRLPILPSAIGVALALICGAALMELVMSRSG